MVSQVSITKLFFFRVQQQLKKRVWEREEAITQHNTTKPSPFLFIFSFQVRVIIKIKKGYSLFYI